MFLKVTSDVADSSPCPAAVHSKEYMCISVCEGVEDCLEKAMEPAIFSLGVYLLRQWQSGVF